MKERNTVSLFLTSSEGWSCQLHWPAALTPEKESQVPIVKEPVLTPDLDTVEKK
jgi:hypothetical protein